MSDTNDQLVLVCGYSGTGKSASLRNIREQEKWIYLNCEAGKRLPFKNKFNQFRIEDPYQVHEALDYYMDAKQAAQAKGMILDSMTFLLDMFENIYINGAADGRAAWGNFAMFFKTLMQIKVVQFGKPVIITAHLLKTLNEKAMEWEVAVPVKGALKNNGIEAYFSTVVEATKMPIKDLEPFASKLLTITDDERELGYKHVFQTRPTRTTTGGRIRSPMGMFDKNQTYIDNCCQTLLDHLDEFYKQN